MFEKKSRYVRTYFTIVLTCILSTSQAIHAKEAFRVCADPKNPPYSTQTRQGYENEIAALFAEELDQTLEYTWFPQRMGFIRNTLKAKLPNSDRYKCDVVMGLPTGYERAITTEPYYRSVYVLIYSTGRGWDDIKKPFDLTQLQPERKDQLKIAMFDRGPGTAWIVKNGLVEQGVPYQSMTGDPNTNTAMTMNRDIQTGKIDMAIMWGPMAGHLISNSPAGSYVVLPMISTPAMKFDFPMSIGVRFGDQERKEKLNDLISEKSDEILAILKKHNVPLIDDKGHLIFIPDD